MFLFFATLNYKIQLEIHKPMSLSPRYFTVNIELYGARDKKLVSLPTIKQGAMLQGKWTLSRLKSYTTFIAEKLTVKLHF